MERERPRSLGEARKSRVGSVAFNVGSERRDGAKEKKRSVRREDISRETSTRVQVVVNACLRYVACIGAGEDESISRERGLSNKPTGR